MTTISGLIPPKARRRGGGDEKYWVGLMSEAGEIPLPRQPLGKRVTFLIDRPLERGAIAYLAAYRTPTGGAPESLSELMVESPAIGAPVYLSFVLEYD